MPPRLHTGGRFRAALGRLIGGDDALGDRAWRRIMHGVGATVLAYYLVPTDFFVVLPKVDVLLAALFAVFALEGLRHAVGLELPTIRPYEERRVASFVFYAIALVGAILVFPVPIAVTVILGVAIVDPVVGELRFRGASATSIWVIPITLYTALALIGTVLIGGWPWPVGIALSVLAAVLAVAAERPNFVWVDDDLAMTFVPALALYAAGVLALGLPS